MRLLAIIAVLLAAGCERRTEAPPEEGAASAAKAATAERATAPADTPEWTPETLPIEPRHRRLVLSKTWLAGDWADDAEACRGTDNFIHFSQGANYSDCGDSGRYWLRGNRIRFLVTKVSDEICDSPHRVREQHDTPIKLLGPNAIEFANWADEQGKRLRMYRCPPSMKGS